MSEQFSSWTKNTKQKKTLAIWFCRGINVIVVKVKHLFRNYFPFERAWSKLNHHFLKMLCVFIRCKKCLFSEFQFAYISLFIRLYNLELSKSQNVLCQVCLKIVKRSKRSSRKCDYFFTDRRRTTDDKKVRFWAWKLQDVKSPAPIVSFWNIIKRYQNERSFVKCLRCLYI